jgi:hypothetical protein
MWHRNVVCDGLRRCLYCSEDFLMPEIVLRP